MVDFQDWLLSPENARSIPGANDRWRFERTSECTVNVLLDYQSYFDRLASLFSKVREGGEIFLVGWEFDLNVKGKPSPDAPPRTLLALLQEVARKAKVQLVITENNHYKGSRQLNDAAFADAEDSQIAVLMDHQLPASSTQHQKAVYVRLDESRNGQGSYLFVGGMDVSRGRVGNWFDAQAEITGRGAELGVLTLEERWASLKGITGLAPSFMQRTGNNHTFIQFVRNYGKADTSDKERGRTFAPEGDFSYYHLLKHAIKKTQSFIYVEDQFFSGVMGLDKLLLDAVEGGAYVVAVAPNVENFSASQVALAQDLASKIKDNVTRKERIRLLRPRDSNPNSLVHTKTWIFDDKLVIVGSGNYWNKSLNSGPGAAWEGELGVAIASTLSRTDFPGVPFAHALRVGMWERLIAAGSRSTFKFKRSPEATFHEELSLLDSPTSPFERLV